MNETQLRDDIASLAKSLFDRGLTFGSSGNISARLEDGWLMTPTGSTMGNLNPARISKLDLAGNLVSGDHSSFAHIHRQRGIGRQIYQLELCFLVAGRAERAEQLLGNLALATVGANQSCEFCCELGSHLDQVPDRCP